VDIGDQQPSHGCDPEPFKPEQVLVDVQWLRLNEICELDRAFLWAAGLLGVDSFLQEVISWKEDISYPR